MKRQLDLLIFAFALLFFACGGNEPEPIIIGEDLCAHCKMKIMDKRYGAEVITNKGKIFKYDAVECMINQDKLKEEDIGSYYVIDFSYPGVLVNAKKSFYLISENLPSPMGANLTSFKNREEAEKHQKEFGGSVYDWQEVIEQVKRKNDKKDPQNNY